MSKISEKILYVVGGVNGAGKSTFIQAMFGYSDINHIDVDRMAMEMFGDYSMKSNINAGKQAIKKIQGWPVTGKPIIWESTLNGNFYSRVVELYKNCGYIVDLTYIYLMNPETHLERIRQRVESGGHDIDREMVAGRFQKRGESFTKSAEIADDWRLVCNQAPWFETIAFGHGLSKIVSNYDMYNRFYNADGDLVNSRDAKRLFGFQVPQKIR